MLLPPHELITLQKAAIDLDLHDKRGLLLGFLDPHLHNKLRSTSAPGDQVLMDLQALNRMKLEDGTQPLRQWLEGAIAISHPQDTSILQAALDRLNSSATPERRSHVEEPASPPDAAPTNARRSLEDFLVSAFSRSELARLVAYHYADFRDELPDQGSPRTYATSMVDELQRRERIDQAFFRLLAAERPRRAKEIDRLRETFLRP